MVYYACPFTRIIRRYVTAICVRPTSVQPPDAQVIRQNINAAWRPASVQQTPRVVATSAPYGRSGPDIAIPSSWHANAMQSLPVPYQVAGQPGYSVNHAHYGAEQQCWAKQIYAVPPAETISLEISVVREGRNKRKGARGIPFGNICEGKKDVDTCIDAPGLMALALDTILPKVQAFAVGFPWCHDQFIIQDGGWVDLSTHPPCQPYFYSQCMHATRKGSCAMTFKSKQFLLYVVVPMAQWEDYEIWLDKAEEEQFSMHSRPGVFSAASVEENVHSSINSSVHSSAATDLPTISSCEALTSEAPSEAPSQAPGKRRFLHEITSVPSLPPLKKVAPAKVAFCSPDQEQLWEVLQSGGTADITVQQMLTVQHENINFFPILTCPLSVILEDPELHAAFRADTELSHSGRLTVQTSTNDMLGIGGFKTAHPGFLTLFQATLLQEVPSRWQQKPNEFHLWMLYNKWRASKAIQGGKHVVLGTCIANISYEYIDHCVSNSSEPPPFHIPRLRFVEASLTLSHDHAQSGHHKSKSPAMPWAVYLVEELITDEFLKYILSYTIYPVTDPKIRISDPIQIRWTHPSSGPQIRSDSHFISCSYNSNYLSSPFGIPVHR
ncbi:hypothetical protein F4604DRAFT_1919765 [Suillus subluteus]|nr:hypothetical protein F4604DRAFT_1919765 [Suillus subluteus]